MMLLLSSNTGTQRKKQPTLFYFPLFIKFMQINTNIFNLMIQRHSQVHGLEHLVQELAHNSIYEEAIKDGSRVYNLKTYNMIGLTPEKVIDLHHIITIKFYRNFSFPLLDCWYENELRVFVWLLVGYSYLQQTPIKAMGEKEWTMFSSMFNEKSPHIFQYQSKCLLKSTGKSKKWQDEESELLMRILELKENKNRWNEIAKDFFVMSNKRYFRTAKQCRQQWINHLDPTKVRTAWTLFEDKQVVDGVIKYGNKWSKIAKELGGKRSQHMVKNRFKSLLNAQMKKTFQEDHEILMKKLSQRLQSTIALKNLQSQKTKHLQSPKKKQLPENKPSQNHKIKQTAYLTETTETKKQIEHFKEEEQFINLFAAVDKQLEQLDYVDKYFAEPSYLFF